MLEIRIKKKEERESNSVGFPFYKNTFLFDVRQIKKYNDYNQNNELGDDRDDTKNNC